MLTSAPKPRRSLTHWSLPAWVAIIRAVAPSSARRLTWLTILSLLKLILLIVNIKNFLEDFGVLGITKNNIRAI